MAHFAKIENKTVVEVIVISNEICNVEYPDSESLGQSFIKDVLGKSGLWLQTSYNNNIRYNYAGIGYLYDAVRNAFIAPKANCHLEEVLDEETCTWSCPNALHTYTIGDNK